MLSIIFGLSSALGWGAADFTGGLVSRQAGAYRVVFYGEIVGMFFIIAALWRSQEALPPIAPLGTAVLAGALGSTGLLLLYHSLARGKMSLATPVSALMAATLPVLAGTLLEGFPGLLTFLGFGLSLCAIWLISQDDGNTLDFLSRISDMRLPFLAGLGFGSYFILVHEAAQQSTYWTMFATRSGGILIMLIFMSIRRKSWRVSREAWPLIALNGFLDVAGNGFYILASQTGRLDVSAVLSSLYPGVTVLLAWVFLKEHVSRAQTMGILLALVAISLLTL